MSNNKMCEDVCTEPENITVSDYLSRSDVPPENSEIHVNHLNNAHNEVSVTFNVPKGMNCYPDSPISLVESGDSCDAHDTKGRKRKGRGEPRTNKKTTRKHKSDVYEVEAIVDHVEFEEDQFFLVKWRNWSSKYSSWEPQENVDNCHKIIEKYFSNIYESSNITREELSSFSESFFNCTKEALSDLMKTLSKDGKINYNVPSYRNVCRALGSLKNIPETSRNCKEIEKVKKDLLLRCFHVKRLRQLRLLKDWENEINASSLSAANIVVENDIDFEGPPENFYYVNEYIPGSGVTIPNEPVLGCSCTECSAETCTCVKESGCNFAYRSDGTIQVSSRVPIYECNKLCSCSENCSNRVVQKGCKVKLSIFRTANGCGWGVKALQNIPKGTFICEYVGEVINNEEAEERGRKYDSVGQTYLFDLDYNEGDHCPYTVDAAFLGNISHFINHSCSPNLAVYAVWINCLDPDLPNLALFARKNIRKEDEITFDYMSQAVNPRPSSSTSTTQCKCGSSSCRKYLF